MALQSLTERERLKTHEERYLYTEDKTICNSQRLAEERQSCIVAKSRTMSCSQERQTTLNMDVMEYHKFPKDKFRLEGHSFWASPVYAVFAISENRLLLGDHGSQMTLFAGIGHHYTFLGT